ncbi:MAG: hypothetical protein ABFS35_23130 [Bacteroidota bacterium]
MTTINKSYKPLLISFLILLLPLISSAKETKELPPPFNFIKWEFNKKKISKTYEGYSIDFYKHSKSLVGIGKGKFVRGKLKTTTVNNYNWKDYFPIDIHFHSIKKSRDVEIVSKKSWYNCDNPELNKSKCEIDYKELNKIYENTLINLNKAFGKKGEYVEMEDQIEGEKMYTWIIQGFEISFMLIVEDYISYLRFLIREN